MVLDEGSACLRQFLWCGIAALQAIEKPFIAKGKRQGVVPRSACC